MKENLSKNERDFVLDSIDKFKRIDGRGMFDSRSIDIHFGKSYGMVEVQLGKTRVYTAITCDIVEPKPERPNEGFYIFNTNISPMSNVLVDPSRPTPTEGDLGRIIEKGLKESRAIDTEALCIVSGSKVWSIKVSIHVIDDCGNILDCASISVITALMHFRKPDVTVIGNDATIHAIDEREPVPLSIHHSPVSITFGFFPNSIMIVDPETKEESVMDGKLSFLVNIHKEICGISKGGGTSTTVDQVLKCSKIAVIKAAEINLLIKEKLHQDIKSRQPNLGKRRTNLPLDIVEKPTTENNGINTAIIKPVTSPILEIKVENKFNNNNTEFKKKELENLINNNNKISTEILNELKPVVSTTTITQQTKKDNVNMNTTTLHQSNNKEDPMVIDSSDDSDDSEEEETQVLQPEIMKQPPKQTQQTIKMEIKAPPKPDESDDLSVALIKKKKPTAKKVAAKK